MIPAFPSKKNTLEKLEVSTFSQSNTKGRIQTYIEHEWAAILDLENLDTKFCAR